MSAFNFPAADFAPQLAGYTGQGAFRFWCQKVLPIVYDDSLSYYELLGKVVHYLNNVIKDMATAGENIDSLLEAYKELEGYINQYLDLEKAVSDKLDKMADDGTLSKIFSPVIEAYFPEWLENHPEAYTTVDYSITQKVYNTVMDMAMDARLEAGDKVCTCGYYTPYDGGGACYEIREVQQSDYISDGIDGTTSASGVVKLVVSGLCAEYCHNGNVNVLCCGVKRDTDEDQFERLFRCVRIPNIANIYVPKGRYILSNTILIPSDCTMYGDGVSSKIYYNGENDALGTGLGNGGSNVTFKSFRVDHLAHKDPTYLDETGVEHHYFQNADSIFMYTDKNKQLSDFLGGIGISNLEFDSWVEYVERFLDGEDPSTTEILRTDVKNIKAIDIYSESCYPLQCEPTPGSNGGAGFYIEGLLYENIYAPNGMVSLYPQRNGGTLKDVRVNNIDCLYFRVGTGHRTGREIVINDVICKVARLADTGISVNNLTCNGNKGGNFNWYAYQCSLVTDIIMNNIKLIYGSDLQPIAFGCGGVGYWMMDNCELVGFTGTTESGISKYAIVSFGDEPLEVFFTNCYFNSSITSNMYGRAVNCVGSFPPNVKRFEGSLNTKIVAPSNVNPDGENFTFNNIAFVICVSNSATSDSVGVYLCAGVDENQYYAPIYKGANFGELDFTFRWSQDANERTMNIKNLMTNYCSVMVITN